MLLFRLIFLCLVGCNICLALPSNHECYLALLSISEKGQLEIDALRANVNPILNQEELDSTALLESLGSIPEITQLFRTISGRLTIREHTKLVLDQYKSQKPHLKNEFEALQSKLKVEPFLRLLLAIHDLGKGGAIGLGGSSTQHEFNAPLAEKLFLGLGFSTKEANLAKTLLSQDALGELAQGKIDERKAHELILSASKNTGFTPQEFYALQLALFTADASSYRSYRHQSFEDKDGKLIPKSERFYQLAMLLNGEKQSPKLVGKDHLLKLGFDPSVASRMMKVFPEVVERINNIPENTQAPRDITFPYFTKFADGVPLTLYRGINIYWKDFVSNKIDTKNGVSYTTTDLFDALGRGGFFHSAPDLKGIVLEIQVPRFFVRNKRSFPVLDIKEMKDLAPYIRRVGINRGNDKNTGEKIIDWNDYDAMPAE